MSRDQKPGKIKVVSGASPNYGRRATDKVVGQPLNAQAQEQAVAPAANPSSSLGLLLPLLFLAACAMGGAGAIFFGLAESLPQ